MKYPHLDTDTSPPAKRFLDVFRYSRRALELVWSTSKRLAMIFALLTLVAGVLPAAVAWIGQLIVDGVVAAMGQHQQTGSADTTLVLLFVAAEAGVVALIAGAQRGIAFAQEPGQCFSRVVFGRGRAEDLGNAGVAQFG